MSTIAVLIDLEEGRVLHSARTSLTHAGDQPFASLNGSRQTLVRP